MKFTVLLLLTKLRNKNYINSPPQPTHYVIDKKFRWESRNFINNYNVNVVCCKLCLHFSLSSDSLGKFETHFDTILEISIFMNNWETWQRIVNLCTSASNDNQDELFVLLKISLLVAVISTSFISCWGGGVCLRSLMRLNTINCLSTYMGHVLKKGGG